MSTLTFARSLRSSSFAVMALIAAGAALRAQDAIVPDNFPSIQAAVNGAADTDADGTVEIFVRAGTYNENVLVQRAGLSLIGESAASTFIQGSGALEALRIDNAQHVEIAGFTVSNHGTQDGIEFQRARNCSVHDCVLTDNRDGLVLNRNAATSVFNNLAIANTGTGIKLAGSLNCLVVSNTSQQNGSHGFRLQSSSNNSLSQNVASNNAQDGFRLTQSSSNLLSGNTALANSQSGLRMRGTSFNSITQNTLAQNLEWGIRRRDWNADDFDGSLSGVQDPIGDNNVVGNHLGALRED
jgi:parallel beta-helix repeat protein